MIAVRRGGVVYGVDVDCDDCEVRGYIGVSCWIFFFKQKTAYEI